MAVRGILPAADISASGLSAQRRRMNAIASNIANIDTTRTEEGGPYRRRFVVMTEISEPLTFRHLIDAAENRLAVTDENHFPSADLAFEGEEAVAGVEAEEVVQTGGMPKLVFDPDHPDADENGYVAMPDVNIVTEMVDMISATRSYEANVTAINAAKDMAKKALEI